MKKIYYFFMIILLVFTLTSCKKQIKEDADNDDFNLFLDDIFYDFLGTDPMNINTIIYNLDNFKAIDAKVEPYVYDIEAEKEYFLALKDIKTELNLYTDDKLSSKQELTRDILIDYIKKQVAFEDYFYYGTSLGSYLGYQAQLPLVLAEYRFDDCQDINDYFDYLRTAKATFANIIAFEKAKSKQGIGLTNYIIDKVIEQCDNFINVEENYLIPTFNDKIDQLSDLSSSEKRDFKAQHEILINEDFVLAYNNLKNELLTLKNTATHNGSLASFPKGKAYYQVLFQEATGSDMTIPEVREYLQEKVNTLMGNASIEFDTLYEETKLMNTMNLSDLIPYFITKMEDKFPKLDLEVNYEIKDVHLSMQENASPAMYFISPIDENIDEVIYINPLQFNETNNYTYQTIAHEGFPGHLYQNLHLKSLDIPPVRKILRYSGYSEGWATYVENYVVSFVNKNAVEAFQFYDSLSYVILGLLDIGINYEGWNEDAAIKFINNYFSGISYDDAIEMYNDLTEIPTNYLQYYFSYYQVQDLKAGFKKKMGNKYSDYLFHKIYLETGPSSFAILKAQYDNYK